MKETPSPQRRSAEKSSLLEKPQSTATPGKSMAPPAFQLKAGNAAVSPSTQVAQPEEKKGAYKKTRFWRKWEPNQADLFAALEKFPKGKWAKELFEKTANNEPDEAFKCKLHFVPGGGTYYNKQDIIIDSTDLTIEYACSAFIHEVNHLSYAQDENPVRASACFDREKYQESRYEEEAEGDTLQVEAVAEMKAAGIKVRTLKKEDSAYKTFMTAHKMVLKKALADGLPPKAAQERARAAGKEAILVNYRNGVNMGSTGSTSYKSDSKVAWDTQHPEADGNGKFPESVQEGHCTADRSKSKTLPPK
jgi:hypothetical protein